MSRSFIIILIALVIVLGISALIVFKPGTKAEYVGEIILTASKDNDGTISISEKPYYAKYKEMLDPFLKDYISTVFQENGAGAIVVDMITRTVRDKGRSIEFDITIASGLVQKKQHDLRLTFHKANGTWELVSKQTLRESIIN
jgi:hypothetical protein